MKVDSKFVNKKIWSVMRPLLKEAGFTRFTSRSSWRYSQARIEVVNFQSFNSHTAAVIGCTTYSFSINLGCYLTDIPCQYGDTQIKEKEGDLLPEEFQCPFRGGLSRSFVQPELERRDIWYIDPEGRYIDEAVEDIGSTITTCGFSWFERLSNASEILRILLEEDEDMKTLWGFGKNPSPIRHYLTGHLALKLGQKDIAKLHLQEALSSKCFNNVAEQIERNLKSAA